MCLSNYAALMTLVVGLAACSKTPAPHYHFSTEQLAWQPYQKGQVLRFGNSSSSTVRTYTIQEFDDGEHHVNNGPNLTPFPTGEAPYYQEQEALIQRTDTAGTHYFSAARLRFDYQYSFPPQSGTKSGSSVVATIGWPSFEGAVLPVDDLNAGIAPDTTIYPGIKAYSTMRFGNITYAPVIRAKPFAASIPSVTIIYYAKGSGVVAFEDRKTGLWYRLP